LCHDHEACAALFPEECVQVVEALIEKGGERCIRRQPVQDGLDRVPDKEEILLGEPSARGSTRSAGGH
jgi:hypothetical protein